MLEIMDFVSKHKKAVIAVLVMLLCITISGNIAGRFAKNRDAVKRELDTVNNEITNVESQLLQPKERYRDLDHGYSSSRVERDRKIIIGKGTAEDGSDEWISRFLNWSDSDDYTAAREWFVAELGAQNRFCREVMKEYSGDISGRGGNFVDTREVSCEMDDSSLKVCVNSIESSAEGDIYNYIVFVGFRAKLPYSDSSLFEALDLNTRQYIVMISVDAKGEVIPDSFIVSVSAK